LEEQAVFIAGAGSAGIGIARALAPARPRVFDSKGLVTADRGTLRDFQRPFASNDPPGSLLETARRVRPTVLVGVTGRAGIFTRELLETMRGPAPVVFPLSNPTDRAECTPEQAREWTQGRAIVATGSPFPGTPQGNNLYVFPGVGLGAVAAGAREVTDGMFAAAARTLADLAPDGALYPPLRDIRRVSTEVALAVAKRAVAEGAAAPAPDDDLRRRIAAHVWEPAYVRYRPFAPGVDKGGSP
jgi:malate dehydrogenase (oxaloacetate-decarboxylating)